MYAELSERKLTVYPPRVPGVAAPRAQRRLEVPPQGVDGRGRRRRAPGGATTADRQNFGKMLLVSGCIGTDFCK